MYRHGFTIPLLKCVTDEEAKEIMKEVHEGVCSSHIGGVSLAAKVLRDVTSARDAMALGLR